VIAYPLSYGPYRYATFRHWLPGGATPAYWPLLFAMVLFPPLELAVDLYRDWWLRLALRHENFPG
jgi:hypothetical protein